MNTVCGMAYPVNIAHDVIIDPDRTAKLPDTGAGGNYFTGAANIAALPAEVTRGRPPRVRPCARGGLGPTDARPPLGHSRSSAPESGRTRAWGPEPRSDRRDHSCERGRSRAHSRQPAPRRR